MDEDWKVLLSFFPDGWQDLGRSCGAFCRLPGFRSEEDLLRVLLLHAAQGYSLRETVVGLRAGLARFLTWRY